MRWLGLIVLTFAPTLLVIITAEVAVVMLGVEARVIRRVTRKLYPPPPNGGGQMFATRQFDPILSWRLSPNAWLPRNIGHINSMGFVGPERSRTKPRDTLRIVTLGDSVTYGAWSCDVIKLCRSNPYPEALETILWPVLRQSNVEVLNAGVYGYNTLQGLRYFRTYLGDLDADVVTIMFGWNDHGQPRGDEPKDSPYAAWQWLSDRAAHLASYRTSLALLALRSSPTHQGYAQGGYRPRVTDVEMANNLERLIILARQRSTLPILLTEPTGPLSPEISRYPDLQPWKKNEIRDFTTLKQIHDRYNDVVRQVAKAQGAALVDVDREFARRDPTTLFDPFDMVHPNEAGHRLIAEMLRDELICLDLVGPRSRTSGGGSGHNQDGATAAPAQ